ncbi:hypothetical protein JCM19233_810 [Vibrio astriarenae]|nr:hypothetical protein JCM19233_810 [Vibrio sp. C7]
MGKTLYQVLNLLGVEEIDYNQPASERYPNEIPCTFLANALTKHITCGQEPRTDIAQFGALFCFIKW